MYSKNTIITNVSRWPLGHCQNRRFSISWKERIDIVNCFIFIWLETNINPVLNTIKRLFCLHLLHYIHMWRIRIGCGPSMIMIKNCGLRTPQIVYIFRHQYYVLRTMWNPKIIEMVSGFMYLTQSIINSSVKSHIYSRIRFWI